MIHTVLWDPSVSTTIIIIVWSIEAIIEW